MLVKSGTVKLLTMGIRPNYPPTTATSNPLEKPLTTNKTNQQVNKDKKKKRQKSQRETAITNAMLSRIVTITRWRWCVSAHIQNFGIFSIWNSVASTLKTLTGTVQRMKDWSSRGSLGLLWSDNRFFYIPSPLKKQLNSGTCFNRAER